MKAVGSLMDRKRTGRMVLGRKVLDKMVLGRTKMGKKVLGKQVRDKMGNRSILSRLLPFLRLRARHLVVFGRKDRSLRCTAEKMDILVCSPAGSLTDILGCNRCKMA